VIRYKVLKCHIKTAKSNYQIYLDIKTTIIKANNFKGYFNNGYHYRPYFITHGTYVTNVSQVYYHIISDGYDQLKLG
jgi:hypothetical protein